MTRTRWNQVLTGLLLAGFAAGCGSDGGDEVPEGMVLVPAGDFMMGCGGSQGSYQCKGDEAPVHAVNLNSYYIDIYEVTAAKYKACVDAGRCSPALTGERYNYNASGKENHPINGVDWMQATVYCQAQGKRLPTEAEWEKAARGTDDRVFPWGNTAPDCTYANFIAPGEVCVGSTSAVGSYPKGISTYGAFDMAGNIYEWVNDWYDAAYYSGSPSSNPAGPAIGTFRARRGGAWNGVDSDGIIIRGARRGRNLPANPGSTDGFRCAQTQ